MLELLAPAKNKECAIAAINYGADAVYIGASEFGARKNAPNPLADIEQIVEYAHRFNAKVYVTVNTILKDSELKKVDELVKNLKNLKVDALIVQDMALVEIAKKYDMNIHASTQCDNRTAEKVKFLEDVGFSRVVLARELSLSQIKEIRQKTNVELECFIHGALCVSYSGQCYLSYAIGGRSANRGECAQACRKKYTLIDEKGKVLAKNKYLLCLKDFNLSSHLKELDAAGVLSLKIEGRLKDVDYVKNVTAYYRKKIDELGLKKTSLGHINFDFESNPEKSFNRGFTDYFFEKRKNCYTFDTPKSKGEFLGKVKTIGKDFFTLDKKVEISAQDGLCFEENGEISGALVNKFENGKIFPNKMPKISVGDKIFRNLDVAFEKQLKISKTCRKIFANIEVYENRVKITDETGCFAEIEFEIEEIAKNSQKMIENIKKQLKKTGESIFEIEKVSVNAKNIPFLPISKLNELRRELIEKLEQERKDVFAQNFSNSFAVRSTALTNVQFPKKEIDYSGNVLNLEAQNFYKEHGANVVEKALESGIPCNDKCVMTTKHCLRYAFDLCKKEKHSDISELFLVDEKGKKYSLKFDCKNCEMAIYF